MSVTALKRLKLTLASNKCCNIIFFAVKFGVFKGVWALGQAWFFRAQSKLYLWIRVCCSAMFPRLLPDVSLLILSPTFRVGSWIWTTVHQWKVLQHSHQNNQTNGSLTSQSPDWEVMVWDVKQAEKKGNESAVVNIIMFSMEITQAETIVGKFWS